MKSTLNKVVNGTPTTLHSVGPITTGVKTEVIPVLGNKQSVIRDFANHSVFFVDPPRPITGEAVFERLWFADSFKWLSFGLFD